MDDLVDEMATLLDAACTLEDNEFRVLAFSSQKDVDAVRQNAILQRGCSPLGREWFHALGIRGATGPVRVPPDPARGMHARFVVPARHLGRTHAFFWLIDPHQRIDQSLWPDAERIADRAGAFLSLVESRQASRDELYRTLVEGRLPWARQAAVELAQAAGMRVDEPVTSVILSRPDIAKDVPGHPTRPGLVWAREERDTCVAVVRASRIAHADSAVSMLAEVGPGRRGEDDAAVTRIGVGPVVPSFDDLSRSRAGALVALRVASRAPSPALVRWSDLGPLTLLGVARDADLAWTLIPDTVRAFLEGDHSELVETATAYLDEAGSVARTAQRLGVHRQTVYQRLGQVQRLTEIDLATGDGRLRLHLALLMSPHLGGSPVRRA